LNRFGEVLCADRVASRKVGHRAGDAEHPVCRACRQAELGERLLEEPARGLIGNAEAFDLCGPKPAVRPALSLQLAPMGGRRARADRRARFARARCQDFIVRQRRHLDAQVDPVEQWARQFCAIAIDLFRRTCELATFGG